eukprot:57024-Rhodomonas_salina.1
MEYILHFNEQPLIIRHNAKAKDLLCDRDGQTFESFNVQGSLQEAPPCQCPITSTAAPSLSTTNCLQPVPLASDVAIPPKPTPLPPHPANPPMGLATHLSPLLPASSSFQALLVLRLPFIGTASTASSQQIQHWAPLSLGFIKSKQSQPSGAAYKEGHDGTTTRASSSGTAFCTTCMGLVLKWVYGATSLRSRYGTDNAYGATRSLGNESSYGPNIKALADCAFTTASSRRSPLRTPYAVSSSIPLWPVAARQGRCCRFFSLQNQAAHSAQPVWTSASAHITAHAGCKRGHTDSFLDSACSECAALLCFLLRVGLELRFCRVTACPTSVSARQRTSYA